MLVPIIAAQLGNAFSREPGSGNGQFVAQALAFVGRVELEVDKVQANLTNVGISHVNGQIAIVLLDIRLGIAGIFKVHHFLGRCVVTRSGN